MAATEFRQEFRGFKLIGALVKADSSRDTGFPLGVELTRVRSRHAFFARLGSLLDPTRRYVSEEEGVLWAFRELVFVVVAEQAVHDDLAADMDRIFESVPDARVVPISLR